MNIIKKINFTPLFLSFLLIVSYYNTANAAVTTIVPKPEGANLGGMFTLEDWFFSPPGIAHDVSTTCDNQSGVASSRLFTGDTSRPDFKWTSETDLIHKLKAIDEYTDQQIEDSFQRHRDTYLLKEIGGPKSIDENFARLQSLGIKLVRLPVTWTIQYDHPYSIIGTNGNSVTVPASKNKIELIPDPFFPFDPEVDKLRWASIPISQIENILTIAGRHDIHVIIDIHAYPGGSSNGTYNGVWPKAPRFWSVNKAIYQKNFQTIFGNLVEWADNLPKTNAKAFLGLAGLTPMNEPAHLMGFLTISKNEPDEKKKPICDVVDKSGNIINWGASPQDVLDTLALATEQFRNSGLPKKDVKLYTNVIETMYDPSMYKQADKATYPFSIIGDWWKKTTRPEERNKDTAGWAVLDIHHYIAWDNGCNNTLGKKVAVVRDNAGNIIRDANGNPFYQFVYVNGVPDYNRPIYEKDPKTGNFIFPNLHLNLDGTYNITEAGKDEIRGCSKWFSNVRGELGLESTDLLAASEFSAGSNADTWQSGSSGVAKTINADGTLIKINNYNEYRNAFIEEQIKLANEAHITAIFWTWMIPYNSNFQNEWALYSICNSTTPPSFCSK